MSDRSLTDLLADAGIHHKPSDIEGKRDLYNLAGEILGTFDAHEAFQYLERCTSTAEPGKGDAA